MIVTVANLKGGAGKTTTAVHLAHLAQEDGPVVLVDADPQQSSSEWARDALLDDDPLAVSIERLDTPKVAAGVLHVATEAAHVVIDTPPGHESIVTGAVSVADLLVIPMRPTVLDMNRLRPTLDLADAFGTPAVVLISQARTNTRSLRDVGEVLDELELPVFATVIPTREALASTFGTRPTTSTLDLFRPVWEEIKEIYKVIGD